MSALSARLPTCAAALAVGLCGAAHPGRIRTHWGGFLLMSGIMENAKILFLGSGPFGLPALDVLARRCGDALALAVATVPDAPRGRPSR